MLKICHARDPVLLNVPAKFHPVVRDVLDDRDVFNHTSPESAEIRGFVVFVEKGDGLDELHALLCRDLNQRLEGVFHAGDCLVGVVLWGNSGDGVSIVCPDVEHYAVEIVEVLKNHLPLKGESL